MIFLGVMPLSAAFFNFLVPLQIGARDVAFPRLNLGSFYLWLIGAAFTLTSLAMGGFDTGWTFYTPYSTTTTAGGVIPVLFGVFILGFSSIFTGMNFVVTVHKLRPPGMTWFRMPLFLWALYATAIIQVLATPVLGITLLLLIVERTVNIGIFNPLMGGDPVLYQHFFWFYSHPAVYIMILPSMGVVTEIISNFSRKRLFGYHFVAFSTIAIGALGFLVWGHHMFPNGQSTMLGTIFSFLTMTVAIPSAIKVFNWTATMYRGSISFEAPMLYAFGFIGLFTIGGLSGVTHAVAPSDTQQTDTYHIVAHFHYVIVGGAVMGLFAGFYYWWPKMFGKMLSEKLGKWNFWLMFFGINLTFAPMHILGLQGQPRRMVVWPTKLTGSGFFDLAFWNKIASIGAFVIATGVLLFVINVFVTWKKAPAASLDPWDARTLEWITASPPKEHNFDRIPTVHSLDEFFHRKYEEQDTPDGPKLVKVRTAEELLAEEEAHADAHIHLPSPSYWPIVLALALPIIAYGVIYNLLLSVAGLAVLLLAIFGWCLEPSVADDSDYDPPAGGEPTKELATLG